MTVGANRIRLVFLHTLAHRQHLAFALRILIQWRHIPRRRWRGRAEQIFQNPFATDDRRSPVGVGGHHQDGSLPQQTFPRLIGECHALKTAPINVRHAVMPGEPLIHECVIRGHQIEDVPVLAYDAFEEQRCLALESLPQVVVEIRELLGERLHVFQVPQIEPLRGEVRRERLRFRIGQHTPHLLFEHRRRVQQPLAGCLQELIVGDAAPKKE